MLRAGFTNAAVFTTIRGHFAMQLKQAEIRPQITAPRKMAMQRHPDGSPSREARFGNGALRPVSMQAYRMTPATMKEPPVGLGHMSHPTRTAGGSGLPVAFPVPARVRRPPVILARAGKAAGPVRLQGNPRVWAMAGFGKCPGLAFRALARACIATALHTTSSGQTKPRTG